MLSHTSVKIYESLKEEITSVEQSQIDLQELADAAEKIIKDKFTPEPQSTYTYRKHTTAISVKLDAVMGAMLAYAEECGGESGKRYVASAIVACSRRMEGDAVEALTALGVTWLTHLLFIFKTGAYCGSDEERFRSAKLTRQTITYDEEGAHTRSLSFHDSVMTRDGYKCALTGIEDFSHPQPDGSAATSFLQATHILPAICNFDNDQTSDSSKSTATTFDILVNFTRLPVEILAELSENIDDVSNGMLLHYDARITFDHFYWCLNKSEANNVYTLKIFKNLRVRGMFENKLITFADHSCMVSPGSTSTKRNCPIALPNPHYLAIHAAIGGILNMSGAGNFFDDLLDKYKECNVPQVRSWQELERVIEEEALKESIAESLQSLNYY